MAAPVTAATGDVAAYFDGLAAAQRETLEHLRTTVLRVVPHGVEGMRYGAPGLSLDGKAVVGYAAFTDHCSYLPMSGSVLETAGQLVAGYAVSKGALQFPIGASLPVALVRRLVRLRLDELADVTNGPVRAYYDDGQLKSDGRMKAGAMHGAWRWYRKDGSLMRTGHFAAGVQSGVWETWTRDGEKVTTTRF